MDIFYITLGVLACIVPLSILILYLDFAYRMYKHKKREKHFFDKHKLNK